MWRVSCLLDSFWVKINSLSCWLLRLVKKFWKIMLRNIKLPWKLILEHLISFHFSLLISIWDLLDCIIMSLIRNFWINIISNLDLAVEAMKRNRSCSPYRVRLWIYIKRFRWWTKMSWEHWWWQIRCRQMIY